MISNPFFKAFKNEKPTLGTSRIRQDCLPIHRFFLISRNGSFSSRKPGLEFPVQGMDRCHLSTLILILSRGGVAAPEPSILDFLPVMGMDCHYLAAPIRDIMATTDPGCPSATHLPSDCRHPPTIILDSLFTQGTGLLSPGNSHI